MPAVRTALVVGGGLAGTAAAIHLAEGGVEVHLVERRPEAAAIGSGITLQGNALRELRDLGVWERLREHGHPFDGLALRAPDAHGTLLAEFDDARTGGPDLPAGMGIARPELAAVLHERAAAAGVGTRFATTATELRQDGGGVDVEFSGGSTHRYDLVVGADGVRSRTRRLLGIDLVPGSTGMGIWRAFGPRPAAVTRTELYYGGPSHVAGYCPTGPDSLYAYVVEDLRDRSELGPEQRLAAMRALASAYHGPWDEVRATLTDPSRVNYARIETHVLPAPWNRGRIVLIGDAAHSCPPTLAQGGAQALEDAAVLAELLLTADVLDDALWAAFTARRHARATAVVEASVRIGLLLRAGEQSSIPGVMARTADLVTEPA